MKIGIPNAFDVLPYQLSDGRIKYIRYVKFCEADYVDVNAAAMVAAFENAGVKGTIAIKDLRANDGHILLFPGDATIQLEKLVGTENPHFAFNHPQALPQYYELGWRVAPKEAGVVVDDWSRRLHPTLEISDPKILMPRADSDITPGLRGGKKELLGKMLKANLKAAVTLTEASIRALSAGDDAADYEVARNRSGIRYTPFQGKTDDRYIVSHPAQRSIPTLSLKFGHDRLIMPERSAFAMREFQLSDGHDDPLLTDAVISTDARFQLLSFVSCEIHMSRYARSVMPEGKRVQLLFKFPSKEGDSTYLPEDGFRLLKDFLPRFLKRVCMKTGDNLTFHPTFSRKDEASFSISNSRYVKQSPLKFTLSGDDVAFLITDLKSADIILNELAAYVGVDVVNARPDLRQEMAQSRGYSFGRGRY